MSASISLIKYLDQLIYKGFIEQVEKLTQQAIDINKGKPIKYLCFNSVDTYSWVPPIDLKAKEFLDDQLPKLAPILNERALVGAYLLRFMNQVPPHHIYAVCKLMPNKLKLCEINSKVTYPEPVNDVVECFKQQPEFTLIKKRIFLGGMLYG